MHPVAKKPGVVDRLGPRYPVIKRRIPAEP